ncbi:hypothetical protein E4U55_000765 [Claviceps digitariae]|nr:hypothetical protein E4U55_000765 [Claviceps digitariae]
MASNTPFDMFSTASLATLILSVPAMVLLARQTKQLISIFLAFSFVILSSVSWFTLVSHAVPQPYLDEIFHIPQAQRYCEGRFLEWDDKITTPPGLYVFSVLLQHAARVTGIPWLFDCGASALRFTNVLGLTALAYLALQCRHEIESHRESRLDAAHSSESAGKISTYAIHTAVNITLFPLLFFFSGLYYTDVISTAVVVAAFLNHLKRVGRDRSSWASDVVTIFIGIAALSMRQTNVFWVVIWMGGLEAVHAIKTLKPEGVDQPFMATLDAQLKFYCWRYSIGDVHDLPLGLAWPDDVLFTVISFGIAVLCNPARVVRQIWPYMSVLIAFVGFVAWNGGVVLGDKSNHVATIHAAQMLYIWPFFAFFSLPLLLPYVVPLVDAAIALFKVQPHPLREADPLRSSPPDGVLEKRPVSGEHRIISNCDACSPSRLNSDRSSLAKVSPALRTACLIFASTVPIWLLYLLATVAASAAVVKFNTIVHPFTLADNRHYMFYIFRYTIRQGNLVRFLLIIPYTLTRWMVWGTLAGCPDWIASTRNALSSSSRNSVPPTPGPFTNHAFWIVHGSQNRQARAPDPRDTKTDAAPTPRQVDRPQSRDPIPETDPLAISRNSISTSTGLVFLLATTLSLMTAPLVEPRYFIIPWLMWRLLIPAWRINPHPSPTPAQPLPLSERYDMRLVLETIWHMAINLATGYIFLTKPYVWKDENGAVLDGGRLQRFMW